MFLLITDLSSSGKNKSYSDLKFYKKEGRMKNQQVLAAVGAGLISLGLAGSADAALEGRLAATEDGIDYQAIYDTETDLTWYLTGGFGSRSYVNTWANDLVVEGIDNWSLPTGDLACGFDDPCLDTQYGSLFTALGGTAGTPLADQHNGFYDMFTTWWDANGLGTGPYYTTEWHYQYPGTYAVTYNFNDPSQGFTAPGNNYVGLAVFQGDVSPVPLPPTVWLFSIGLLGVIAAVRRKRS